MNLTKLISIPLFLLSLSLGLIFIYLSSPPTKKIYVYPTPKNENIFEYKDRLDNCFSFKSKQVKCPTNKDNIKNIPIQV